MSPGSDFCWRLPGRSRCEPERSARRVSTGSALEKAGGAEVEAFELYRTASEAGHPAAMADLAYMYETGKGVAKDAVEAVVWYREAADAGYAPA